MKIFWAILSILLFLIHLRITLKFHTKWFCYKFNFLLLWMKSQPVDLIHSLIQGDLFQFYVETYFRLSSLFWALMLVLWLMVFSFLVKFKPTRKFLQAHPDLCSFNMFKEAGPSREQVQSFLAVKDILRSFTAILIILFLLLWIFWDKKWGVYGVGKYWPRRKCLSLNGNTVIK